MGYTSQKIMDELVPAHVVGPVQILHCTIRHDMVSAALASQQFLNL